MGLLVVVVVIVVAISLMEAYPVVALVVIGVVALVVIIAVVTADGDSALEKERKAIEAEYRAAMAAERARGAMATRELRRQYEAARESIRDIRD